MKAVLLIFILLLLGCKSSQNEPEELGFGAEKEKRFIEDINEDFDYSKDCLLNQSMQTDNFLKNIKELEGYFWNDESKTAKIVLSDSWELVIKNGGCNHYEVSATFTYDGILDVEKDKKLIFDKIIWITSLIEGFDGETIKEVIDTDRVSVTKEDEYNYYFNFMDERLYELYFMNFNNNNNVTTFSIGYFFQ
jgi:hypothetical protein